MTPHARGRPSPEWLDAQYNSRGRIPEHPAILAHWAQASAQALERHADMVERAYGAGPRERLDVFPSRSPDAPVLVYIHGGYWRALGKRDHSFVAPPFVDAGAMVVAPDYALCPEVTIEQIVLQMVQSMAWVYRHAREFGGDPSRIVVAGHSAGGHLATMLLACNWASVDPELPVDLVKSVVSISGLYDLEPIRNTPFLAPDLRLTRASARRLSPAFLPAPGGSLVAVVGADESEEFHRQVALIASRWGDRMVTALSVPGRNHMNVLHELAEPTSPVHVRALLALGLGPGTARSGRNR